MVNQSAAPTPTAGSEPLAPEPATRQAVLTLLRKIQPIHATSGDEGRLTDLLAAELAPPGSGVEQTRLGETLVLWKGRPRLAIFAHLDTVGFTVGYDRTLVEIGSPDVEPGDLLWAAPPALAPDPPLALPSDQAPPATGRRGGRSAVSWAAAKRAAAERVEVAVTRAWDSGALAFRGADLPLGTRLAFWHPLQRSGGRITGAGLDNRLGVAIAATAFSLCSDIALVLTGDEEQGVRGALLGGRWVTTELGIDQALIADVTWASRHIRLGGGPVISLRDAFVPRQRYLDRVLAAARSSGVTHQLEVERSGSSDGGILAQSHLPIDWCFVGVPIEGNHSAEETADVADFAPACALYAALIRAL